MKLWLVTSSGVENRGQMTALPTQKLAPTCIDAEFSQVLSRVGISKLGIHIRQYHLHIAKLGLNLEGGWICSGA
jgi:hypothetical protein